MASVQLPSVNAAEQDNGKLLKQLLNAYIMLTEELTHLLSNLDTRNINYLSADLIDVGTLNANLVKIQTELMNGGFITIDSEGMKTNNGSFDTFKVGLDGKPIMTGATVQSAAGYPKVVMDPDSQLFGAHASPTQSVTIGPYRPGSTDSPYVLFEAQGIGHYLTALNGILTFFGFMDLAFSAGAGRNITLRSEKLILSLVQAMEIQSWEKIKNTSTGQTLDQTFAKKGDSTTNAGYHNHGILPGTKLMVEGGGYVIWSASGDHVHVQQ